MVKQEHRSMLQNLSRHSVDRATIGDNTKDSAKRYPNLIEQLFLEKVMSRKSMVPPSTDSRSGWNYDTISVLEYGERNLEVTCPLGVEEGNMIHVVSPDGDKFPTYIPKGVTPGQTFVVPIPRDDNSSISSDSQDEGPTNLCVSLDEILAKSPGCRGCGVIPVNKRSLADEFREPEMSFSQTIDNFLTPVPEVHGRPARPVRVAVGVLNRFPTNQ